MKTAEPPVTKMSQNNSQLFNEALVACFQRSIPSLDKELWVAVQKLLEFKSSLKETTHLCKQNEFGAHFQMGSKPFAA
jgi:hypothetical protein